MRIFKVKEEAGKVLKEPVQLSIYLINYFTQVIFVIREIIVVSFYYKKLAKIIGLDPCFVSFIESFKIIETDRTFIFPPPVLYLAYQCRY